MNIDVGRGWLAEIQLALADVLVVKKELHKFYELERATDPREVLEPVFSKDS